jgi:hypothetical protein
MAASGAAFGRLHEVDAVNMFVSRLFDITNNRNLSSLQGDGGPLKIFHPAHSQTFCSRVSIFQITQMATRAPPPPWSGLGRCALQRSIVSIVALQVTAAPVDAPANDAADTIDAFDA